METQELLRLNNEGLIPGPGESEELFRERIQAAQALFKTQEGAIPPHHWDWAAEQLRALFDFTPRWCSAIYSSKGLAPWQAAATWIDVKRIYTIQLRGSNWVKRLIDRNELLAHEAAHAARAAFEEPHGEEIFAYLTSSAKWRQTIGPLFQRPSEALIFVCLIGAGALFQIAEIFFEFAFLPKSCFFLAGALFLTWSCRLFKMRIRFKRAAAALSPLLRDPEKTRAVLFRLTDEEILRLSRKEPLESKGDLRWRLLKAAYFRDDASFKKG